MGKLDRILFDLTFGRKKGEKSMGKIEAIEAIKALFEAVIGEDGENDGDNVVWIQNRLKAEQRKRLKEL